MRRQQCHERLIFFLVTLPTLLFLTASHFSLIFVDCFTLSHNEIDEEIDDGGDIFSAYLTQAVGHNISSMITKFLRENPLPVEDDGDDDGDDIGASPVVNGDDDVSYEERPPQVAGARRRQRRYVLRNPDDLSEILTEVSNARNWTYLTQQLSRLASHFWYGEWCGVGWTKINETTTCCQCRGGAKSENVDTTLIRNTANDCIKCGAHPIDPVDTSCMLHDICYTCTQSPFDWMMANCECERIISYAAKAADCTRSVSKLYPEMNETMRYRWCTFYKGAIPLLFENKPCYCPRNGQPFVAFSLKMCDRGHLLVPVKAKK